ncbi:MAG: D-alanyl-D-alanine carboxypeptidase [Clostridia bacterium]|nr:D-alanyl-D-alanine carboxypeptidase [Clostridia bacterium]
MKKTFAVVLAVLLFMSIPMSAGAGMWANDEPQEKVVAAAANQLELTCRSAILMEMETGAVVYELNPDERLPEASITKIMTMLLVFEALDSGKITLEDKVACSAHAASMGGSQIWLEEGEEMTVHELIKAALVGSANDASVALAEHIAGSHESFVALMNDRAAQLGMQNTAYKNCTGLDDEGHLTSARDVAIVAAELLRHDKVREYTTIWMDSLRGGETELVNTNKLIRYYTGATGLKTGTTSKAGCCVAATAERDGMHLVAVVMGAPNSKSRFGDASKLLDYGFANCELLALDSIVVDVPAIAVKKGMESELPTCLDMSGNLLLPKGKSGDVQVEVQMAEDVCAPVEYGQIVGTVTLRLDGAVIGNYNILTDSASEAITFGNVFGLLWSELVKN